MKKLISCLLFTCLLTSPAFAAQWDKTIPCKTGVGSCASADQRADFPADQQANNESIDRMLANYREGMTISYSSASALSVSAGEVMVSNAAGTARLMLKNDAATSVTFTDIDTGAEAPSTTYYVYAIAAAADSVAATFKISASSSAPSGVTYYKRIGSFYNDASSNIGAVSNDNDLKKVGAWTAKTVGTTYRALSDGDVIAFTPNERGGDLNVYVDDSTTPTTLRGSAGEASDQTGKSTISIRVSNGEYYKATYSSTDGGSATMYFRSTN